MAASPDSPATQTAPLPPREPALEECCGSGCTPCIFDLYEQAKERYAAELAESAELAASQATVSPATSAQPGDDQA